VNGAAPETLPAVNPARTPEDLAFERGHAERGSFSSAEYDLDLAYSASADLDDRFDATCMVTGERLQVSGWLFQREEAL
jgi:hypothetical protein